MHDFWGSENRTEQEIDNLLLPTMGFGKLTTAVTGIAEVALKLVKKITSKKRLLKIAL